MRRPTRLAKPPRRRTAATSDELAPVFDAVADYFGLLAEPTRLAILHTICNDEKTVSAIVEATGATQTNVSRHLGLLHAAGVVSRRRDGSSVHYRVADPVFVEICRSACVRIAARIDAQSPLAGELLDYARNT
ncbi:MAG TPA: metalloregulator ArsR/SmtB family transcription factor [Casimicrobiaceae bacterium]|jgi:DNA-binding transcriptional ArsR family regulator